MPEEKQAITSTTTFSGPVTAGAISTGSGSITIDTQTFKTDEELVRQDLLKTLQQLKSVIQVEELPKEVVDKVVTEVECAKQEVESDKPVPESIVARLNKAKEILTAVAGMATATTTVSTIINKALPIIEAAVQFTVRLFS